ncbi:MAG: hypothetical protein NWF04_10225 [Candidatus Bathyarchaeota archaeon]|nr:hypothetical protein [Candidatus Bathyarchaeota archaeon]
MQKWKTFAVLATIAALTITLVGFASAYVAAPVQDPNAPRPVASDDGFWGWIGNCFGFNSGHPHGYGYVYQTGNGTVVTPSYPSQDGYYPYGHGCWGGW